MNSMKKIGYISLLLILLALFSKNVFAIDSLNEDLGNNIEGEKISREELKENSDDKESALTSGDAPSEEVIETAEDSTEDVVDETKISENSDEKNSEEKSEDEASEVPKTDEEKTEEETDKKEINKENLENLSVDELIEYRESQKDKKEVDEILKEKLVEKFNELDEKYFSGDNGNQVEQKISDEEYETYTKLKRIVISILDEKNDDVDSMISGYKEISEFDFPRANTKEELNLNKEVLNADISFGKMSSNDDEANSLISKWEELKTRVKTALESDEALSEEEIASILEEISNLKKEIYRLKEDGKIDVSLAGGTFESKVFLLDKYGNPVLNLDKEDYYLAKGSDISLLYQIATDEEKEYTIILKPNSVGGDVDLVNVRKLSINGKVYNFEKREDGSYEVKLPVSPGVMEFRVDLIGIDGDFHEGFEIILDVLGNESSKKFLITKTKFLNEFDLKNIPDAIIKDGKLYIPEIDAGKTEDNKIVNDNDKVIDLLMYLSTDTKWIDRVIISGRPDPVDIENIRIEIDIPKDEDLLAEIVNYGVDFEVKDGKLVLYLESKNVSKNLEIKDGKLFISKGDESIELSNADIKDVFLFDGNKYVYVDENGDVKNVRVDEYRNVEGTDYLYFKDAIYILDEENNFVLVARLKDGFFYGPNGNILEYDEVEKTFNEVEKATNRVELVDDKIVIYEDKKEVSEDGHFKNKDTNKIEKNITVVDYDNNIVLTNDENEKYYAGSIITEDGNIFIKDGKVVDADGLTAIDEEVLVGEEGKLVRKNKVAYNEEDIIKKDDKKYVVVDGVVYQILERAVSKDGGNTVATEYTFHKNDGKKRLVVDKNGSVLDYYAEQAENAYKIYRYLKDENKNEYSDAKFSIVKEKLILGALNRILTDEEKEKYEQIVGKYYVENDGTVVEVDENVLLNNFYYKNKKELVLSEVLKKVFIDSVLTDKTISDENTLFGAINPHNFYDYDGKKVYLKDGMLYDESGKVVASTKDVKGTIQKIGDREVFYDKSVYEVLKTVKFGLNFKGFRAGKDYIYNLGAKVEGKYRDPKDGELKDIFDAKTLEINKKFTLKNPKSHEQKFGKDAPYELNNPSSKPMDFLLFNILFRSDDDRSRDKLFERLFTADDLTDEEKEIKELITSEFRRIYKKELIWKDGRIMAQKGDNTEEINRKLVWTIFFRGNENFPEDDSSKVIIDDAKLDNRLVYDSIVINDSIEKVKEIKKNKEDAKEEFKGDLNLVTIDDIEAIYLGVNPFYTKGDFIPVKGFKITREKIVEALEQDGEITLESGIKIQVSLDDETGKISIRVKDAFLDRDGLSPVQKQYAEEDYKNINEKIENANSLDDLKAIISEHYKDTPCEKELLAGLREIEKNSTKEEAQEKFESIKNNFKAVIKALELTSIKKDTLYKDSRFNALRILLRAGYLLEKDSISEKKILIETVIKHNVDIPYTDEFGNILTNEDMYLYREVKNILLTDEKFARHIKKFGLDKNSKDSTHKNQMLKALQSLSESEFRYLYKKAYENIQNKDIKALAEGDKLVDENGRLVYKAVKGNTLTLEDLSSRDVYTEDVLYAMEDDNQNMVNPFIIKKNDGTYTTIKDIGINDSKLADVDVNIIMYYLNRNGYDRKTFANMASYKLVGGNNIPTLFKDKNKWSKKICFDGILGQCITQTGENEDKLTEEKALDMPTGNFDPASVTISYTEKPVIPDEEKPHVKKDGNKTEVFVDGEKLEEREIEFNIGLKIDHKKLDDKIKSVMIEEGITEKEARDKLADLIQNYNENGFINVKNSYLMDVLPDGLEFDKITHELTIDRDALTQNGANKNFENDDEFNAWKEKIEVVYIENIELYLETLDEVKDEAKIKILNEFIKNNPKLSKNSAVIVFLPDFEAPHGTKEQFKLKIKATVSEDALQNMKENKAVFTSIPWSGEDSHKYSVKGKKEEGSVDKYLRLYDEDGNIITDATEIEEWFKGTAVLHFGEKFDYKIEYKLENTNTDTSHLGGFTQELPEFEIEDVLPYVGDGKNSLRVVLRELIEVPDKFRVIYYDKDGKELNEENIDLKNVYKIKLQLKKGELFDPKQGVAIVLKMEIPEFKVNIKDGKAEYENGDSFDLDLLKEGKISATNEIKGTYPSNPVTVEIRKEDVLKLIKVWKKDGKILEGEELNEMPEVEFEIVRVDKNTKEEKVVKEVKLNKENDYSQVIKGLPTRWVKKVIGADGNTTEETVYEYTYIVREKTKVDGYTSNVQNSVDGDVLEVLRVVENIKNNPEVPYPEIPTEPGIPDEENPNEPGDPTPEEPNEPDDPTPDEPEEPGNPDEENPNEPDDPTPDEPDYESPIPKTGRRHVPYFLLAVLCMVIQFRIKRRG